MNFVGPRAWREWTCVMPGDVVHSAAGGTWRVDRTAPEGAGVWVELRGGVGAQVEARTMYVPDARAHVEVSPGPGWDLGAVTSTGEAALSWAEGLVREVLGGTVVGTDMADATGG